MSPSLYSVVCIVYQYSYYLTHKDDRQTDETTIGSLAGRARAVKFTLVKELTQG